MADLEEEFAFFARATEARSAEHRQIINIAVENKWWSVTGSLLRMELDSLIRVNYLRTHPHDRSQILSACVAGLGFGIPRHDGVGVRRIRDTVMVPSGGWERRVYDFGNRFVHLTEAHNHTERDPFMALPEDERKVIVEYLDHYHRGKSGVAILSVDSAFGDVALYAPHVLEKIADNTRYSLEEVGREITRKRY
ncbi:hypothetical protein [Micromonospora sp. DH14]|uniref:hypothetical protein n=1 Tax=Micromonospora sp. DH14 TaxID=3040120 RepID=UPI00244216AD|nr:hypothetical protein [Micromonospora sp. DH14]MDG9674675.1 hypothetical protein [Micromonospora sp. DH14]